MEKAGAGQKYSSFRKTWSEQIMLFETAVIPLPSLAEKGRPGLHDLAFKYRRRALVKTLSPS